MPKLRTAAQRWSDRPKPVESLMEQLVRKERELMALRELWLQQQSQMWGKLLT